MYVESYVGIYTIFCKTKKIGTRSPTILRGLGTYVHMYDYTVVDYPFIRTQCHAPDVYQGVSRIADVDVIHFWTRNRIPCSTIWLLCFGH